MRRQGTQPPSKVVDLGQGDAPVLPGVGTGGVHPQDRHRVRREEGIHVLVDVAPEAGERTGEARHEVEERDVVIAGDDQLGKWDAIQEEPCGHELLPPCPLRQVAAHRHQRGFDRHEVFEEALYDLGALGPEMEIGDVREGGHGSPGAASGIGANTRRARGRMM